MLNEIKKGKLFVFTIAVIWLVLLFFSYFRNALLTDSDVYTLALNEARSYFNKDIIYRRWNSLEGGVYVPITDNTPPNPYLKTPNRDIETKEGKKLTLVNPAYMTRLVHELEYKDDKVKGHLTSLNPIRPANKADDWETKALKKFEKGSKDFHSIINVNEKYTLRYMAPLITEKSCLNCHAVQGYKVGDIRGGISISIPYAHYLSIAESRKRNDLFFHLSIALIGLIGLYVGTRSSEKYKRELTIERNKLQVNEEKWRSMIKTSPDGIGIATLDGILTQASDKILQMYGYASQEEVIGKDVLTFIDPDYHKKIIASFNSLLNGTYSGKGEYLAVKKDGSRFFVEINSELLRDKDGVPTNAFFIERDITERKQTEARLKSSEENFRTFFSSIDDIIIISNQQGGIFYINDAAAQKLGYTTDELNKMYVLDVYNANMRKEAEQIYVDMFAGKRNVCPLPLERKDGALLPVETKIWFGKWDGKDCIFSISKDLSREQEALQKFNRIFDYNPALMAISSLPERKFTEVNIAFLNRLGYTVEEVIGKTADDINLFVNPEKQKIITNELQNNIRIANYELEVRSKNGEILYGLFSGEIIESQGEKYFLTVMKDITLRKKAEKALEEERQRLARIIEGTHAGTWEWNVQTGETIFNERWAQIVGYTLDELKPISIKTWEMLGHPDDLKRSEKLLEQHFKGELPYYDFECRMRHKNGNWIWIHDRGRVVSWTDDGKPFMMFGTHSDITERKLIEEKLRESEERVRLVIENSPVGIFFYNDKSEILVCNSAFGKIIGSNREKLVGLNISKLPDAKVVECTRKTLGGEPAYYEDTYISTTSSKSTYVRAIFTPVFGEYNKVLGGIAIVEDFSVRKKMEEKIKEYTRELETINIDLTNSKSKLENSLFEKNLLVEELTKAKEELEKTNSEKDKFFSIIAHDLRSPFQGFISITEEMATNITDYSLNELTEYMTEINSRANNLFMLLKNLLEWAKMQRGAFTFEQREISLYELAAQTVDSVKPAAEKKSISIINGIKEDEIIFADENMISSVLTNLLTNAIKFTQSDGVVSVSSRHKENFIEITVSDTGIGMPGSILDKLFKIQEKVGRIGTNGEESSGLGLLLCKEFITKHHGKIWAESVEGQGSKFILTLPHLSM